MWLISYATLLYCCTAVLACDHAESKLLIKNCRRPVLFLEMFLCLSYRMICKDNIVLLLLLLLIIIIIITMTIVISSSAATTPIMHVKLPLVRVLFVRVTSRPRRFGSVQRRAENLRPPRGGRKRASRCVWSWRSSGESVTSFYPRGESSCKYLWFLDATCEEASTWCPLLRECQLLRRGENMNPPAFGIVLLRGM